MKTQRRLLTFFPLIHTINAPIVIFLTSLKTVEQSRVKQQKKQGEDHETHRRTSE